MERQNLASIRDAVLRSERNTIIAQAKEQALEEVKGYLESLPANIGQLVETKIKNQAPFALDHKGIDVLKQGKLELIIPALLTGALAMGGVIIGAKMTEGISLREKQYATQLSLKEEYFKRQFDTYEESNKLLSQLRHSIMEADYNTVPSKEKLRLPDILKQIDDFLYSKSIYLPNNVKAKIDDIKADAIEFQQATTNKEKSKFKLSVEKQIDEVRELLKTEMKSVLETLDINPTG